ncbi:YicC/YloC family endoribonuclease [Algicola sagamiensis]|uniref:YicC/YloC family endoribonuclease n=1 Tax=Algicola sagamiensis TaxID=163869 RepID=UPI00035CD63B|nr:YicC/YloC family endoribonuclease [Algicola sagamiensis]
MIYSMTAYARNERKGEWGSAVWEIRSVNQRYLETFIRLPEQFRALEPVIRERIRKKLQRGKVEVNLKFHENPAAVGELQINQSLANQLIHAAQWVKSQTNEGQLDPLEVLRWPGVMEAEEQDMDSIQSELLSGFETACDDFLQARASEGQTLADLIQQRLTTITEQAVIVRGEMPTIMQWQRDKLTTRLEELKTEIDQTRLEQELVYLAQKVDVAEELDRLDSHVKETGKILKKGGACGRRLDFMMQEFNREANTLASKSISATVTAAAVELKVLIEQMREQIQNIE